MSSSTNIDMTDLGTGSCTVCFNGSSGTQDDPTVALKGHHLSHGLCQTCFDIIMQANPAKCPTCRQQITHVNGIALQTSVSIGGAGAGAGFAAPAAGAGPVTTQSSFTPNQRAASHPFGRGCG